MIIQPFFFFFFSDMGYCEFQALFSFTFFFKKKVFAFLFFFHYFLEAFIVWSLVLWTNLNGTNLVLVQMELSQRKKNMCPSQHQIILFWVIKILKKKKLPEEILDRLTENVGVIFSDKHHAARARARMEGQSRAYVVEGLGAIWHCFLFFVLQLCF